MGYIVDIASFSMKEDLSPQRYYEISKGLAGFLHRFTKRCLAVINLAIIYLPIPISYFESILLRRFNLVTLDRALAIADYDLMVVENIEILPLALRRKKNAKVLLDAREYYPLEFGNSLKFKLINAPLMRFLCDRYLKACDQVITVSPGIAQEYDRKFCIYPALIMSTPKAIDLAPSPVLENRIRLVHHGAANPDRRLENIIDTMDYLDDRFSLDLYLTGNPRYITRLTQLASHNPRVVFQKPVNFAEIVAMLNAYDIGFYLLKPTNFNTRHSLPNKFFEFIQARLMLAIGPSPAMANLVAQYKCGIVAHDFTPASMAELLNVLTAADISQYKLRSNAAARELSWEHEGEKLKALVQSLVL
ncbi:hypothetical protein [Phormidium tenue]|uniref:Glycosyltransferase n=1 Tax=Phormidium tenue NIES-30 TaxID=549789 RepID=A0A1U7J872_9CYAN|nr:hypothetical protein [Phormidium tenue]MBD2231232.1 glycosyltransferase [Phormidium tenue FACHB-1052]OKH49480.1 hypothetical protein NIES30_06435 [Phormidium tenue NIES-30]